MSERKTRIELFNDIESVVKYRQVENKMKVAAEIEESLKKSGLTKTQFARLMGKYPSEVTRWLSGTHNFTIDLLAEINAVLGRKSGIAEAAPFLNEPSIDEEYKVTLNLDFDTFKKLVNEASARGLTNAEYAVQLISERLG